MTKYCVMRECDNIHSWISLSGDFAFSHQDGIYGFKFPERFYEIPSNDLTLFSLFSILPIQRPDCQPNLQNWYPFLHLHGSTPCASCQTFSHGPDNTPFASRAQQSFCPWDGSWCATWGHTSDTGHDQIHNHHERHLIFLFLHECYPKYSWIWFQA